MQIPPDAKFESRGFGFGPVHSPKKQWITCSTNKVFFECRGGGFNDPRHDQKTNFSVRPRSAILTKPVSQVTRCSKPKSLTLGGFNGPVQAPASVKMAGSLWQVC